MSKPVINNKVVLDAIVTLPQGRIVSQLYRESQALATSGRSSPGSQVSVNGSFWPFAVNGVVETGTAGSPLCASHEIGLNRRWDRVYR